MLLQNVSIGIVGEDLPFKIFNETQTAEYLGLIEGEERRTTRPSDDDPRPPPPPDDGSSSSEARLDPGVGVAMETE